MFASGDQNAIRNPSRFEVAGIQSLVLVGPPGDILAMYPRQLCSPVCATKLIHFPSGDSSGPYMRELTFLSSACDLPVLSSSRSTWLLFSESSHRSRNRPSRDIPLG